MPRSYVRRPLADRFWPKVKKTEACWLWTGSTRHGYGQISGEDWRAGTLQAHRVAWELATGEPVPDGFQVLHVCDNVGCVRNDEPGIYRVNGKIVPRCGHLFLGTNADNLADMRAKGRYGQPRAFGDRNATRLYPERLARGDQHFARRRPDLLARGEAAGGAKLTADAVRDIRRRYGDLSLAELGELYGVTKQAIRAVITRRVWAHVTD